MRALATSTAAVVFAAALSGGGARPGAAPFPNDVKTIVHVLNRIAFGPRPGDVERIHAVGLQKYIDEQLHPDRVRDADVTARLDGLTTLHMSSHEIAETFEVPQLQARQQRKQIAAGGGEPDGKAKMPD